METKLLHAILSGTIIALVIGISLIPAIWRMISPEPIFGPTANDIEIIVIIASITIIGITLFSFKFVGRVEE